MAKSKKEPAKVKKHALREQIATTLQTTFTDLKESVGEKKFNRHVKKASKVLAAGAEKKAEKTATPAKAKAASLKPAKAKAAKSKPTKAKADKSAPAKVKTAKPAKVKAAKSAKAKTKATKLAKAKAPAKAKTAKKKDSGK